MRPTWLLVCAVVVIAGGALDARWIKLPSPAFRDCQTAGIKNVVPAGNDGSEILHSEICILH
jgi:hypothetical protein